MGEELRIYRVDGKYYASIGDGEQTECKVNDGKWIALPKNNPSNRQWLSNTVCDKAFDAGEEYYVVPVKAAGPRKLTFHTPNEKLVKYLSEEDQADYNAIIDRAKEAMNNDTTNTISDIEKTKRQIAIMKAKLEALENGTEYVAPKFEKSAKKTLVDYISEDDYTVYTELLDKAETAKAAAPKAERAPRTPMTTEQKIAAAKKRMEKAEAALQALLAMEDTDEDDGEEDAE